MQGFADCQVSTCWFTPIIQGHVGSVKHKLGETEVDVVLITRRQSLRTGTRMNVRGLDDKGNAANFCETEQIVRVNNKLYSFVMTRGSVPIFWEQIAHGS